jgi:hypothetical protein
MSECTPNIIRPKDCCQYTDEAVSTDELAAISVVDDMLFAETRLKDVEFEVLAAP